MLNDILKLASQLVVREFANREGRTHKVHHFRQKSWGCVQLPLEQGSLQHKREDGQHSPGRLGMGYEIAL